MSRALDPVLRHDEISVDGVTLPYALRLSPRRATLCVQVLAGGAVRVMAPMRARRSDIHTFLAHHWAWIAGKRRALVNSAQQKSVAHLGDGSQLPLLGDILVLRQHLGEKIRPSAIRLGQNLVVSAPTSGQVSALVVGWYRQAAREHVSGRVLHFAPLVGRAPRRLSIRGQKTRWGSCSARGTITINWRLMQASAEVLDYVVVHELCHLLHANHSQRFWREVERVVPEYPRLRLELKSFGLNAAF